MCKGDFNNKSKYRAGPFIQNRKINKYSGGLVQDTIMLKTRYSYTFSVIPRVHLLFF